MSNYRKGYRAEREIMEYMKVQYGCVSVRSAGSHSPIDILAGNGKQVFAIQVKAGKRKVKVDKETLTKWAKMFNAIPMIASKQPRKDWNMEVI